MEKETALVKKNSPALTVKSIKVGETKLVKHSDIDSATIRSTVSRLKGKGYVFYTKACPDGIMVTRTQ